ncbi:MAG: glycoside hydrolase family 65 protein, partial [Bacteroidetes bacterium]|nr:glycoside hydrolase family 65 protein [Bacteroidota bacterium]
HNEWEITFEEIHRNGAIAFAIYDYVNYTGDQEYLVDHGLEVLIGISRFWTQRVSFSEDKKKYVMLGVTGPNEFENNVHNNWYTLKLAEWTLNYVQEAIGLVKKANPDHYKNLAGKLNFNEPKEVEQWNHILDNIYLPEDKELGIFLQQDGYLDKELISVKDLDPKHLPIVQNWSWDRILRSCFIKQADVLQGIYLFEDQFDLDTIKKNYDFYEAKTVHESSLSPCVHSILAAKLGYRENAYEFYLRTARLDLDDYNNDTEDGCHITSMAGTWMSIVKGFGGMRVRKGSISFEPFIPEQWTSYSFNIRFRGAILNVKVSHEEVEIWNDSTQEVNLAVHSTNLTLEANQKTSVKAPIPS